MPYFSVQGNGDIHVPHRYSGTLVPPSSSRASSSSSKQRTWRRQYTHLLPSPEVTYAHPPPVMRTCSTVHTRWKAYRSRANCVSRRMGTAWNQRGLPDSATITVTEEQSVCLLSSDVQTACSVEVIPFNPHLVLQTTSWGRLVLRGVASPPPLTKVLSSQNPTEMKSQGLLCLALFKLCMPLRCRLAAAKTAPLGTSRRFRGEPSSC